MAYEIATWVLAGALAGTWYVLMLALFTGGAE